MLQVNKCLLLNSSMLVNLTVRVQVKNTVFDESIIRFELVEKLVLENSKLLETSFLMLNCVLSGTVEDLLMLGSYDFDNSNIVITAKSEFSTRSVQNINRYNLHVDNQTTCCNITLSGDVSFISNTSIYGGALHMYSDSNLSITAGANVKFINNIALAQDGAIYLSASTMYQ